MFQSLEIYLLDDDPVFLQTFSQTLEDYLQQQGCIFQLHAFTDGKELLVRAVERRQADLLIADIALGSRETNGLDVASKMRCWFPGCSIIYLTAFLEFATEIYDTRPLYFILKEEYQQRIPLAMKLFFQDYAAKQETLTVTTGRTQTVIQLQDLIYCEHIGRKTNLVCTGQELLVPDTIANLMNRLPQRRFVICHKGYIVGLQYVKSYCRYVVTLNTGQELPISRSRYEAFRAAFLRYLDHD